MNTFDIRRIDLNLLVVFDILMRERHVSRAADRLARTQSAVSHALARLRSQLDDPLLVNSGGQMRPTPFAERLHARVVPLLGGLAAALQPQPAFDPSSSTREFRLAAPDFASSLFVPLWRAVSQSAPSASLVCLPAGERSLAEVAVGAVDLALVPASLPAGDDLETLPVQALGWRCFARAGHPALRRWGRRAWSAHPHLVVQTGNALPSPVDAQIRHLRIGRTVAMRVGGFSMVAPLLAESDMLATLPEIALLDAMQRHRLESRPVPFPLAAMPHQLVCSRRLGGDPPIVWFRERVVQVLDELRYPTRAAATGNASSRR